MSRAQREPSLPWLTGKIQLDLIEFYPNSTRYHYPSLSAPLIPVANSTLINGLGRYSGGPSSPLAVVNVRPNKRYRIRLASISCDPNYVFSIDNHNMVSITQRERASRLIPCSPQRL